MKRYVVGNGTNGKSDVLVEDDLSTIPEFAPGLFAQDLWLSFETPAENSGSGDPTATYPFSHEPPDGGSIFRIMKLMPEDGAELTAEESVEVHKRLGSLNVPSVEEMQTTKHPSMHHTDTLNYMVVVAGELTALTDERDIVLHPGDVMVQKGCSHGWRNDGTEPAVLVAVMIDAVPLS